MQRNTIAIDQAHFPLKEIAGPMVNSIRLWYSVARYPGWPGDYINSVILYKQIQITVKYTGKGCKEPPTIENTAVAVEVLTKIFDTNTLLWREQLYMLCLNAAGKLLGWHLLSIGGMDATKIDTCIIATVALKVAATRVILAHNHPCGSLKASPADVSATQCVAVALQMLGITLVDHIIITDKGHTSMKDKGIF